MASETVTDSINIRRRGKEQDGSQVYLTRTETSFRLDSLSVEDIDRKEAELTQIGGLSFAYFTLGRFYTEKGDLARAVMDYDKGLAITKSNPIGYKFRSEVRIKKGDLKGAIEDLTIVANLPMHLPDNHLDKGILLLLQGKDTEAQVEFDLHLLRFPTAKDNIDKRIEEAKKLLSSQKLK